MKKFTMKDESFVCENCGKIVEKLNYTARDHCPYCLYSKHLDINPGDRLNNCLGLLKPIDIEKFKNTYKIIYKCEKCGKLFPMWIMWITCKKAMWIMWITRKKALFATNKCG